MEELGIQQTKFAAAGDREAGVPCAHCGMQVRLGEPMAQCGRCGTVHHHGCWQSRGGCGSYSCAPANRAAGAEAPLPYGEINRANVWTITADELDRAVPLPAPRPPFSQGPTGSFYPDAGARTTPPSNRRNRIAIAALVVAIAGIPLVGLVTGVFAIILACIALGTIGRTQTRGVGMAVAALLIGVIDVVGWIFLIIAWRGPTLMVHRPSQMDLDPAALRAVDPTIADAMRANVVISSQERLSERMGSGVVMKLENGVAYVLTNRHVVDASYSGEGAATDSLPTVSLAVRMIGAAPAEGKVVWIAPSGIDLAIATVKCNNAEVRVAKYPAPNPAKIGDSVFAVGNPHALGWSLSPGSISQIRKWPGADDQDLTVIQTTAPINSGNSGGGLYDKDGFLIGINTWTEDKQVSEGIGFAISIDRLLKLAPATYLQQRPKVETKSP
jgi:S1-C subfamily serine protease